MATKPEDAPEETAKAASSEPPKSRDARKSAMAILEALAGQKTPQEAAESIGVSVTYYYTLEQKALEGLVKACEPKPRGRTWTVEKELEQVRVENAHLRRELKRAQALTRAAQRAIELAPTPAPRAKQKAAKSKGKRKKKATVRALKAIERIGNTEAS